MTSLAEEGTVIRGKTANKYVGMNSEGNLSTYVSAKLISVQNAQCRYNIVKYSILIIVYCNSFMQPGWLPNYVHNAMCRS